MNIIVVALVLCTTFFKWLRHQRRLLIHRERLAAVEQGQPLPTQDPDGHRGNWAVRRLLILAGLPWISLAVGLFILLAIVAGGPPVQVPWERLGVTMSVPLETRWIALAPFGMGLAHLLVCAMGRSRDVIRIPRGASS